MRCIICKRGKSKLGAATMTLERGGLMLIIQGVPALACGVCGEEYVDEETTAQLLETAEQLVRAE
jgi:YgiT-type zinc finger domain-containing protein